MSQLPAPQPQILFIHRSPGGQFEYFGKWLAQNGWQVTFLYCDEAFPTHVIEGCHSLSYQMRPSAVPEGDYRYGAEFAMLNALGVAETLMRLKIDEGYRPDLVMAHVGWGLGLCVKQIFPSSHYIAYHEWYYTNRSWGANAQLERPYWLSGLVSDRVRNMAISTEFDTADANWCPTDFQASRFPPALRQMIEVVPDGVDCAAISPDPSAEINFDWLSLPKGTPILTYATRGMEPIRGFPQFMQAVAEVQRRRPDVHTVILGNDRVSYGNSLPAGQTWRLRMFDELPLDHTRLHIYDMRAREDYVRVLQASTVHCYFSEPFVISWSLYDALAAGCLLIGSDTAPLRELVTDMENGVLVDMDDPSEVADMIEWAFDNPEAAAKLRANARAHMLAHYDMRDVFPAKEAKLRAILAQAPT